HVVLRGHFSCERPPTTPDGATFRRMVTVSNAIVISGTPDENGERPTIEGGFVPFFVDASGSPVAIQGLHFLRPQGIAIWIFAVSGVGIADCRIEGVEPSAAFGSESGLSNPLGGGMRVAPAQSEHVSGTLWIAKNDIDVASTAGDTSLGIALFSAGTS